MLVDRSKYKYIDYLNIDEKQSNVGHKKKNGSWEYFALQFRNRFTFL